MKPSDLQVNFTLADMIAQLRNIDPRALTPGTDVDDVVMMVDWVRVQTLEQVTSLGKREMAVKAREERVALAEQKIRLAEKIIGMAPERRGWLWRLRRKLTVMA